MTGKQQRMLGLSYARSCKMRVAGQLARSKASHKRRSHREMGVTRFDQIRSLQGSNFLGLGYGAKETNGAFTGDAAVRIYVKRKVPLKHLSKKLQIPNMVSDIITDVVPIGTPRFHDVRAYPGAGINHGSGGSGSFGCVATVNGDSDTWFVLSASHVLAPLDSADIGDPIFAKNEKFAELSGFQRLQSDGEVNAFDAAVARIDAKESISSLIPEIGVLQPNPMMPILFQSLRKFGATTLHSLGVVTDISSEIDFLRAGDRFRFENVIQVTGCGTRFTEGGDSGALAVDALSSRPVGLVIGGSRHRSFLSPIQRVLERFNMSLLTLNSKGGPT